MSKEGAPAPRPVINNDGTLNKANLASQYGLGEREANQQVTFGTRTGTVAEMLNDVRCPVGGIISSAFQESGLAGVEQQFGLLQQMSPGFEVTISEETRAQAAESKKKPMEESSHERPPLRM